MTFRVDIAGVNLHSDWTGLNEHLLATITPVDRSGAPSDAASVMAPLSEGNIEVTGNWESPFEGNGVEGLMPAITRSIQSGHLANVATMLGVGDSTGIVDRLRSEVQAFASEGVGRSGMTKLNSTQVFTGAAPVKFSMTMVFRAFKDPKREVQDPIDQLAQWTLARQLAANGSLVQAIENFSAGQGFLKSLLPSVAPQMVGLRYGGYLFAPLVIESMSRPLVVPITKTGEPLHMQVQLVLASLSALDADDWTRSRQGKPIKLFNNA